MEYDPDIGAMSSQGLIDGIIDHFEDHMVQASAIVRISDVHTWALAYRIKAS